MKRQCKAPDCTKPHNANGYCATHDARMRRTGKLTARHYGTGYCPEPISAATPDLKPSKCESGRCRCGLALPCNDCIYDKEWRARSVLRSNWPSNFGLDGDISSETPVSRFPVPPRAGSRPGRFRFGKDTSYWIDR